MAIKTLISFLSLVLFLCSCSSTKVSVTVIRSPQVEMSAPLQKIAVINRVNHTANTKQFVNGHIITQFNGITPIMVNEATRKLNQSLLGTYLISSFDTTCHFLPPNQNFNRSLPNINAFHAACNALKVDAIITVDGYDANVDSDSEVLYSTPVDRTYGTVQIPYFQGEQSVEMRMLFRIHSCTDSAVYEGEVDLSTQKSMVTSGGNFYEIKNKQRHSASILVQAAQQIGNDLVYFITPLYEEESRKLYGKGNKQMEQAFTYANHNNWKAAADIWYLQATSANSKIAHWATFNLITANEMLGNFDEAISMAKLCATQYQNKNAQMAITQLQYRKQEMIYLAKTYPRLIVQ